MSQSLETKPSSVFFKFASEFAIEEIQAEQNNELKTHYWNKMKTELEVIGYPPETIGRTIRNTIEDEMWKNKFQNLGIPREDYKWHSGHFYDWCRMENISQMYNTSKTPAQEFENSSINTPYYEENKDIINLLYETREFYDDALSKLKTQPLVSMLDGQVKQTLKQSLHDWKAHLKIARDIFNEKQKVPSNTIHILLHSLATESTINYATIAFFDEYKKILTLTAKQAGKYRKGIVTNMIKLFKPLSRDIAIFLSYYGMACERCDSWCVVEETDKGAKTSLRCLDCEHTFQGKTVAKCSYCQIPLYKEDLQDIINYNNQCQNCNKEIHLPKELLEYVRE